jgi:hypothetical protein
MENQKRKWLMILILAVMSITLIFGATGCVDDNNDDGNVILDDNNNPPASDNSDVDVDVNTDKNEPATNEPAPDTPAPDTPAK